MEKDFFEVSYERHQNEKENNFDHSRIESWKVKDTTDYWRHNRMYENLSPLIEISNNCKWLTIGDGRYGTDANYLSSRGIRNVLATDISDTYLKIALKDGFISDFKVENAEALSFENNSFDFVLCKESYHHFPRPMIALYEMLRVAKQSVILIEPQDSNVLTPSRFKIRTLLKWSVQVLKNKLKSLMGKEAYYDYGNYEPVGNYVFTISEREIEKVALGLNYEMVSFKSLNDHYIEGAEFEKKGDSAPLYGRIKSAIEKADRKMKKGLLVGGLLIAIIHKAKPSAETVERLSKLGYINRELPRNPYV